MSKVPAERPSRRWSALVLQLIALLAVSAAFRFPDLGRLGLYGDEDLSALAVQGVRQEGIPRLPSGLLYTRGLPYTYLAAWTSGAFEGRELALRIPSAVFGTATPALLWSVGSRYVGGPAAALAAWLLAFSGWHIDMSREGRMYAMFLALFLLCLRFFPAAFLHGRRTAAGAAVTTGLLTTALHELGILLLLLWWIAAWMERRKRIHMPWLVAASVVVGTGWFVLQALPRVLCLTAPGDATLATGTRVAGAPVYIRHAPALPLLGRAFEEHTALFVTGAALALASAWTLGTRGLREGRPRSEMVAWAAAWGFALLGLGGMVFACALTLAIAVPERVRNALRSRSGAVRLGLLGAMLATWLGYGLLAAPENASPAAGARVWATLKALFGYPAPHITSFLSAFPLMTFVVAGGTAATLVASGGERTRERTLLAWFWIPLLLLGFTREWLALRYALPVYPSFLLVFALTVTGIVAPGLGPSDPGTGAGSRSAPPGAAWRVAGLGALLLLVPIVNEQHGLGPARAMAGLRYGRPVPEDLHGFPHHPDHQSAGRFVRERLRAGDWVLAMDDQAQWVYAGRVDVWVRERRDAAPFTIVRKGVPRSRYTGARLATSREEIEAFLERRGSRRAWIITSAELTGRLAGLVPPGLNDFLASSDRRLVFQARDGITRVYRFDARTGAPGALSSSDRRNPIPSG